MPSLRTNEVSTTSSNDNDCGIEFHDILQTNSSTSFGRNNKVQDVSNDNSSSKNLQANNKPSNKSNEGSSTERLSQIEQLALRLKTRSEERIKITKKIRKTFLHHCEEIKEREGYRGIKIHEDDLIKYRDDIQRTCQAKQDSKRKSSFWKLAKTMGFLDPEETLLDILNKAIEEQDKVQSEWFYFGDFNFFYTVQINKWPWMRSSMTVALTTIFIFFLATPVLFCAIMNNDGICPSDPTDRNRSYYGWVSALYFASTTMSTVGYGDLSVFNTDERPESWVVFIGALYMIVALAVAIVSFSAAADNASTPVQGYVDNIRDWVINKVSKGEDLLREKIKLIRVIKYTEIILLFFAVNLIGIFASRLYVRNSNVEAEQWTWMESLYWSVQTTTTIGYGDMSMSFSKRFFQIFYLLISTYFVGAAFGKLGSLQSELLDLRRKLAWERREISKHLIEDMQADYDDKVDQYEFVIASLLTLGKISYDDINPIMNKFRSLDVDGNGYITQDDLD